MTGCHNALDSHNGVESCDHTPEKRGSGADSDPWGSDPFECGDPWVIQVYCSAVGEIPEYCR